MAVTMELYATPTVPSGSEVVVMVSGATTMVRLNVAVAVIGVLSESVTATVNVNGPPNWVGVPESTPAVLKPSPVGSVEPVASVQVSTPNPPVAWNVKV